MLISQLILQLETLAQEGDVEVCISLLGGEVPFKIRRVRRELDKRMREVVIISA